MPIANDTMRAYAFLAEMYADDYYPDSVVDMGKAILVKLCEQIEATRPADDDRLLALTHAATEAFNALEAEFHAHDSEIETGARECIGADFEAIAKAYGFGHVDVEDLIAPRDW